MRAKDGKVTAYKSTQKTAEDITAIMTVILEISISITIRTVAVGMCM